MKSRCTVVLPIVFLIGFVAGVLFQRYWGLGRVAARVGLARTPALSPYQTSRVETLKALSIPTGAVVFLGDSLLNGQEWQEVFDDVRVVSRAVPGATSRDLAGLFDCSNASGIVCLLGANDTGIQMPPEEFIANYEQLFCEFPRGVEVVLISIPPIRMHGGRSVDRRRVSRMNEEIRKLAFRSGHKFLDPWPTSEESSAGVLADDGLHLSPRGYEILSHAIEPDVREMLALKRRRDPVDQD